MTRKLVSFFLITIFLSTLCPAQSERPAPPAEKEKARSELEEKAIQILEQAIADASYLRLPQNKALVYAMAGDLYWKFDEKKARELFRSTGVELAAHNIDAEQAQRENTEIYPQLYDFNSPRNQLLPIVAKRDAELALELLVQTRPAGLAEAILRHSAPDFKSATMTTFNVESRQVRQEIDLEQRFALLAADENPDRAIKLVKESLAKGVSFNVLQLLQKLHKKDEKKAADLAGDVVRKIVDLDLARKQDEFQAALSFLQFMAREAPAASPQPENKSKDFRFTEGQAKELANKLAAMLLQPSNSGMMAMALARALPSLEKILPEKAALLRQRQSDSQRSLPVEYGNSMRMQRVYNSNSTAEEILAEIPKLQNDFEKSNAYQFLLPKIAQIDDEARARKLIDQLGDEKVRARALDQFESARITRIANAGKLEDARKMIGSLTNKRTQIQKLVSLAQAVHRKGSEADLEAAASLMKQARSMINESPEDEDDLNSLMEVVRGYAVVDPNAGFSLFEPIVEHINDIIHASAILSKYNKRSVAFKKGELILRTSANPNDGNLLFRYLNQMQLLAKADLVRMGSLADRFQRSDSRTLVKLMAVQGFLMNSKQNSPTPPQVDVMY